MPRPERDAKGAPSIVVCAYLRCTMDRAKWRFFDTSGSRREVIRLLRDVGRCARDGPSTRGSPIYPINPQSIETMAHWVAIAIE